jgi:hypothetical protein
MAGRFWRIAAGVLLLAAPAMMSVANAQNSVVVGAARSVDLRTAPTLQTPPMPPIFFNRPTMPIADYRAAQQRGTAQMPEPPPEKTGGGR